MRPTSPQTQAATAHKRGRPKSADKAESILTAAREMFLNTGYSAASVDSIAQRAGVSKATVYAHFGSKEALFTSVVQERRRDTLAEFQSAFAGEGNEPAKDLEQFAIAFQRRIMIPETHCWHRLVISEADRHPDVARTLFESGPATVLKLLTRFIRRHAAEGRLTVSDPVQAAEHFLGLVIGIDLLRGLLASLPKRSSREREERARAAVKTFLARYGPTRKQSTTKRGRR